MQRSNAGVKNQRLLRGPRLFPFVNQFARLKVIATVLHTAAPMLSDHAPYEYSHLLDIGLAPQRMRIRARHGQQIGPGQQ
jgi:hypothetical protein